MSKALQVSPELKPCPLDGGKLYMNEYTNKGKHWAACKCGFRGPMKDNEQAAIEAVNRRTTTDAVPKGVVAPQDVDEGFDSTAYNFPTVDAMLGRLEDESLRMRDVAEAGGDATISANAQLSLRDVLEGADAFIEHLEDYIGRNVPIPLGVLPFDAGEGVLREAAREALEALDVFESAYKRFNGILPDGFPAQDFRRIAGAAEPLRAALSGRQAATWQPMETAPRGGNLILLQLEQRFHGAYYTLARRSNTDVGWYSPGGRLCPKAKAWMYVPGDPNALPSSPELNRGNGT